MLLSLTYFALAATLFLFIRKYYVFAYQWLYARSKTKTEDEKAEPVIEIAPLLDFDIDSEEQRPYRPWSSGKFAMTMGIRKLPEDDLFLIDKEYVPQQKFRRYLLAEKREDVMQIMPGSEEACEETLDLVVRFLTKRYPQFFVFVEEKPGYLHNRITDIVFKISKPYEINPLEVAAQLVMEDLNLLMQGAGDDPEQHYL